MRLLLLVAMAAALMPAGGEARRVHVARPLWPLNGSLPFLALPRAAPDGARCSSASDCLSAQCSSSCCGDAFVLNSSSSSGGGCIRVRADERALQNVVPSSGIALVVMNLGVQGFRFVTSVGHVTLLFDTGSSSLMFCQKAGDAVVASASATFTGSYGCDAYGVTPTPTNLPTIYGAASKVYKATTPLALDAYGTVALAAALFKVATTSQGLDQDDFCSAPLSGIWGAAGDSLDGVTTSATNFPQCTVAGYSYSGIASTFPALVAQNGMMFGLLTDFQAGYANIFLGSQAVQVATSCALPLVGQVPLGNFNADQPTSFVYYQAAVTSCTVGDSAPVSLAGSQIIFDTGTENLQLPPPLFNAVYNAFGDNPLSGTMSCILPGTDGGTVTLNIDLDLAEAIGNAQNIYTAEENDQFILGVPFFAQFYWVTDLNAGAMSVYTYAPSCPVNPGGADVLTNAPSATTSYAPAPPYAPQQQTNGLSEFTLTMAVIVLIVVVLVLVLTIHQWRARRRAGTGVDDTPISAAAAAAEPTPPRGDGSASSSTSAASRPMGYASPGVPVAMARPVVSSSEPLERELAMV